ncbi:MAG TPA: endonuclease III [Rectinemataceae bacterium]
MGKVLSILLPLWPDPQPQLWYSNCFELLCSVVLSAQTTDEQVNAATPALFKRFPDPVSMAAAPIEELEMLIHSVGFFRTKARHLKGLSAILAEQHGSQVPGTMEALLELPGVGRKTANLVLSACTGEPGVIVDTHVLRLALRLGWADRKDPLLVERLIRDRVRSENLTAFSHALNRHGKTVCTARNPACAAGGFCPLERVCPKRGVATRYGPETSGRG